MPESGGSNIEVAEILSEHKGSSEPVGHALLEIMEALVLAVVAIATALERLSGRVVDWASVRIARRGEQTASRSRGYRHICHSGAFI
jgi:hypothetical protein